ncbi:hypothetical protein BH09VER1_BH09VER1_00810 [soil metagenome]
MSTLYVLKEGQKRGPFTTEELEEKVASGEFAHDDQFWTEGMDGWLPLSDIIQVEIEAAGEEPAVAAEESETSSEEPAPESHSVFDAEEAVTLYDTDQIKVTSTEVELSDVSIPIIGISKVTPQIEKVHRVRPLIGCVILGVLIVCLILAEIPKTAITHWVIWGALLLGLGLWWLRCLFAGLRSPRSMLVIDLTDGDEHVARLSPDEVTRSANAIKEAIALLPVVE